jgi:hypothetical protein
MKRKIMTSEYEIGLTAGTMTALDALATPLLDPMPDFQEFRRKDRLGDMSMKGRGPQTVIWKFAINEIEQATQLEIFMTGDPIYIRSKKKDDSFGVFQVMMNLLDPRNDGFRLPGFVGNRMENEYEFIVLSEVV